MSEYERLTRIYQKIFGDDILEAVLAYEGDASEFNDSGDIPTCGSVVLEFRNGAIVHFGTSEWGGINNIPAEAAIGMRVAATREFKRKARIAKEARVALDERSRKVDALLAAKAEARAAGKRMLQ